MDVMTMALAKPKTIKLENYPAIYEAVIGGIASGGGTVNNLDAGTLFKDLKTNRPLQITFNVLGINVKVTGVTVAHPANSPFPTQISMKATMQMTQLTNVTIIINQTGNSGVSVIVING